MYEVEIFAFIYPDLDIINLLYSIPIKKISIDEFIFVRKVIQFDKKPITLINKDFFKEENKEEKYTFSDFSEISKKIYIIFMEISEYKKFGNKYIMSNRAKSKFALEKEEYYKQAFEEIKKFSLMMIEVRDLEGIDKCDLHSEDFMKKFSRKIYGLMVCDEGWRFVPLQCSSSALEKCFCSRDYFCVFASNVGVLEINLIESDNYKKYNASQKKIGEVFNDKDTIKLLEPANYAGLNSGALLAMERATMLHVIIGANMTKDYCKAKLGDRKIICNRRKMIEAIDLVMNINISEMSTLTDMIMDKLGIYKYVERVKERLDLEEDDNMIIYQKSINSFMKLLTLVGLIIAFFSLVVSLLSADMIRDKLIECLSYITSSK